MLRLIFRVLLLAFRPRRKAALAGSALLLRAATLLLRRGLLR
jgi:hypothetical protein